ncbi:DUF4230 domain-containing protein [Microbispora triticiradicis]|uniref:DUF4230 domain-containing protein n=1 Tax=Microbispora TaxID=2005 RepID=UPI001FCC5603|nr:MULTISPECIES: DUF4230 domain-containing protein [Microbispora]GLW24659.1 hypothetical protein Mame01_47020 [Microbispora amethystogenes]
MDRQTRPSFAPADAGPTADAATDATTGAGRPARRPGRGWRVLAGLLLVIALLVVGARLTWSWIDPLGDQTIDRSGPALLRSVQNLSRFEAATGEFQVIVDLEKDAKFLPDAIKGSRTLFVGAGSVDAYVDFSGLPKDALTVSPDRKAVTVRLPHAELEKPNLDNKRSYVFAQERGIFDRISDVLSSSPQNQQELYVLAERKIGDAAAASDLRSRADQNTKAMMEGMLKSLGFTSVTIKYTGEP